MTQRERIAQAAFDLWQQRGRPEGSAEDDWLEAERKVSDGAGEKPLSEESGAASVAKDPLRWVKRSA